MNKIMVAQNCELENLDCLFLELTSKNCNLSCKHCILDLNKKINKSDFLSVDTIKETLKSERLQEVKNIYLTGAEPLLHPQFNLILRSWLKKKDTTIITNGIMLNEKKARFFSKVEDEQENTNLFFKISIDHYDELKHDSLRGRGSFRKSVSAVLSLIKYGFDPMINIWNYYKEEKHSLLEGFKKLFSKYDVKMHNENFRIIPYCDKTQDVEFPKEFAQKLECDCKHSRVLTSTGIYNCKFLSNDFRARSGSSINDFSKKSHLETEFCSICIKEKKCFFSD